MFQSTVFLQVIIDLHNPTIMGMVPWPHHTITASHFTTLTLTAMYE